MRRHFPKELTPVSSQSRSRVAARRCCLLMCLVTSPSLFFFFFVVSIICRCSNKCTSLSSKCRCAFCKCVRCCAWVEVEARATGVIFDDQAEEIGRAVISSCYSENTGRSASFSRSWPSPRDLILAVKALYNARIPRFDAAALSQSRSKAVEAAATEAARLCCFCFVYCSSLLLVFSNILLGISNHPGR